MTLITNTAEGGSNGNSVTTGNSGGASGTAFSAVNLAGTSTLTFDNTQAAHGSLSYHCTVAATSSGNAYVQLPGTSSPSCAGRVYIRFNTQPASGRTFMLLGQAAFLVNSTSHPAIQDGSGTIKTFTGTVTTGVWYRLEMETTAGTTTTNGYIAARYFLGDSTTPVDSFTSSTVNAGTSNITSLRFGLASSPPLKADDVWIDDLAINDGTTTPIGPAAAAVVPFAGWGIRL